MTDLRTINLSAQCCVGCRDRMIVEKCGKIKQHIITLLRRVIDYLTQVSQPVIFRICRFSSCAKKLKANYLSA